MTLIRPGGRRREEACCTCATLLSTISSRPLPPSDVSSEKPVSDDEDGRDQKLYHQRLSCCARIICADCISKNPRFLTYCPYCQSSGRSSSSSSSPNHTRSVTVSLPPPEPEIQEAEDTDDDTPPPYTELPPAYTSSSLSSFNPPTPISSTKSPSQDEEEEGEDILHFLTPTTPSPPSPSCTISHIPFYAPITTSPPTTSSPPPRNPDPSIPLQKGDCLPLPRPHEGEEEEARKGKIRRWMVATKEHDYDIAVTYLEGAGYDFQEALSRYRDDVEWERANPMRKGDVKKKGRGRAIRGLMGGLLG